MLRYIFVIIHKKYYFYKIKILRALHHIIVYQSSLLFLFLRFWMQLHWLLLCRSIANGHAVTKRREETDVTFF